MSGSWRRNTLNIMHFLLVSLSLSFFATQVTSYPNGGIIGAKKFATADDCSGVVAFSSVGGRVTASKLTFTSGLLDKSIGWSRESGEFTCHCPGVYQFSFAGSGDQDTRLSLKKKPFKTDAWTTVLSTGPGGGSNLVLLEMEIGDQVAIFLDAGKLHEESEKTPLSAFSGFRISKK